MNVAITHISIELTTEEFAHAIDAAQSALDAGVISKAVYGLLGTAREADRGRMRILDVCGEDVEDLEELAIAIANGGEMFADMAGEEEGFDAITLKHAGDSARKVGDGIVLALRELRAAGSAMRKRFADDLGSHPGVDHIV